MGWTGFSDYPHLSRAEIIRKELSQPATADNPRAWGFEYMAERGAVVYGVMWHDAPDKPRRYFGIVVLTSRKDGEFLYKEMSEDCGPYYYDAPKKMLDMLDQLAPDPGEYAQKWRAKCREKLAAKKSRTVWQAGDRIEYGGAEYTLRAPAGRGRGWIVEHYGMTYRIPARALSRAVKLDNAGA